ncbi:hypothetical protein Tco_0601067 [Tanacetum coccineum]
MVAYLEESTKNADFDEIVDFLNANPIRYALTVSPTIYVSYIEQFWSTVKTKTVNNETQIRAKVDGKTIVITESSMRRDLHFNDEDGFCKHDKERKDFSETVTSLFPSMLGTQAVEGEGSRQPTEPQHIPTTASPSHSSGPTTLVADETVHEERRNIMERAATTASSLEVEQGNGNIIRHNPWHHSSALFLRELVQVVVPGAKIPYWGTGLLKLGLRGCLNSPMIHLSQESNTLGVGKADLEITHLKKRVKKLERKKKSRTPQLKRRLFKVRTESSADKRLGDQEDASKQGRNEIDQEEGISWFQEDAETQGRYGYDIEINTPNTLITITSINITTVEPVITASAPVVTAGVSVSTAEPSTPLTTTTIPEKPVKVKGKDQIEYDADMAKRLQAELDKQVMLERERKEKASNAALIEEWDIIEPRIDADAQLAKRLQAEEREHIIIWQDTRIRISRVKALYAIKQMFDKAYKQVNDFVPMDTKSSGKKAESSRKKAVSKKRASEKLDEESVKRQKVEDDAEKAEFKACLEIVLGNDSADNIESLATKYLIVDWKTYILAEDKMYYQIIRADRRTKYYKIFTAMLDDFDRHDVLDLYRLIKERFETTSPEGYDRLLWGDLITLFKPSKEDEIWKAQQDYTLISWRLYDSCGVHLLLMDTVISIHMLVQKKYPLTQEMLSRMLSRRLAVDHECEMAFELLQFTRSRLKK